MEPTPSPFIDEKPTTHHATNDDPVVAPHTACISPGSVSVPNILAEFSVDELLENVRTFAQEKGLGDKTALFEKAALVAREPTHFEQVQSLSSEELEAFRNETAHRWRQPFDLYLTVGICSLGAAVQGWDQTGSNGANLSFPAAFGIDERHGIDPWIVGLINAAPYYSAALIGCWLSDPLNYFFGRRVTIFVSAMFCLFPVIGSALSQNWVQLLVTRVLMGIGMGCKASTVPVFAAENAPALIRGALVMGWQMWTAFGIFLGLSANLAVYNTGDISWRLQLGSAFIPAVPLAVGVFFCPESPRWYIKKNRYVDAYKSLSRLRNTNLQAARDLYLIHCQLAEERAVKTQTNYAKRLVELFTIPRVRRATLASFTVMIAQQMCGINIIAFYSSTIFFESGFNTQQSLLASWGYGLLGFIFVIPTIWTIDRFGRRTILLYSFPHMAWTLLAAGLSALAPSGKTQLALIVLFVFLFDIIYSLGEGPVPFTYSAEAFPLSHREVGMSWAVATCFFWSSILSLTFPTLLAEFGQLGAFGFYAGLNVLALVMIFLFVPETKQRTLEELDYVFGIPTRVQIKYQVSEVLTAWLKRVLFIDRHAKAQPLVYDVDKTEKA